MASTPPPSLAQTQEISRSSSESDSQDDSEGSYEPSHAEDTEISSEEETEKKPTVKKRKRESSKDENGEPKKKRKIQRMIHTVPEEDVVVIFRKASPQIAVILSSDYKDSVMKEQFPDSFIEVIPSQLVEIKLTEDEKLERKRQYRLEYQKNHVGKKKPDTPEAKEARRKYNQRPEVQENKKQIAKAKRELLRQEKMKDPIAYKNKIKELKQKIASNVESK